MSTNRYETFLGTCSQCGKDCVCHTIKTFNGERAVCERCDPAPVDPNATPGGHTDYD